MLLDMVLRVVLKLFHDVVVNKDGTSSLIFGILSLFTVHELINSVDDIFCRLSLHVEMMSGFGLSSLLLGQTLLEKKMLLPFQLLAIHLVLHGLALL